MPDELLAWLVERLDQGVRRTLDASTPEGYVFAVDSHQGSWAITAELKHGMGPDRRRRVFEIQLSEVK